MAMASTAAAQDMQRIDFDIEPKDLSTALTEFGIQSGAEILFVGDDVKGKRTKGLEGTFTTDQAIEALLNQTGIKYRQNEDGVILVGRRYVREALPEEGVPNPVRVAQTRAEIRNSPDTDKRDDQRDQIDEKDTIVVTGTRVSGSTIPGQPNLTVLDRDAINALGAPTLDRVLATLPQNFGSQNENALQFGTTGINRGRSTSPDLRGLGADSTLVLLNGRRLAAAGASEGAGVDVSAIPLAAVERVDVLTDGGSAIYGADAVGGVVNFILRDNFEGVETSVRYDSTWDGKTDQVRFGQLAGFAWDTGELLLSGEYTSRSPLLASERSFSASQDLRAFGGNNFQQPLSSPGNIQSLTGLPLPGLPAPIAAIPNGQDGTDLTVDDLIPGRFNLADPTAGALLADDQALSLFASLRQELAPSTELFAETLYADRETESPLGPVPFVGVVGPSNPYSPFGVASGAPTPILVLTQIPDTLQVSLGDLTTLSSTIGLTHYLDSGHQLKLFSQYTRNESALTQTNALVQSPELFAALSSPDPVQALNPFSDGTPGAGLGFGGFLGAGLIDGTIEIITGSAIATGPMFQLPGGTLRYAAGLEYRHEDYDNSFETRDADGNIVPGSLFSSSADRDVTSFFGELALPLISAPESGADPLAEAALAARVEDYSDFGAAVSPKVSITLRPTQVFAVYGSFTEAYRAPLLSELGGATQANFDPRPITDPETGATVPGVFVRTGANPDLEEETADIWNVGVSVEVPNTPVTVKVNYFDIEYENQIIQLSPVDVLLDPESFSGRLIRDDAGVLTEIVAGFANAAQTKTSGIDFSVSAPFETELGRFSTLLAATYVDEFEIQNTPIASPTDEAGRFGRPADFRARASFSWQREVYSAAVNVNHTGEYTDDIQNRLDSITPIRDVDAYTTVDLQFGMAHGAFDVQLGVNNLLDEDPPFINFPGGFDPANADPRGRAAYLQLRASY